MNEGGSAGNPNAAPSCSHPVHTDTKTSEPRRVDHQSTESGPSSGSQNDQQSPGLTHQRDQSRTEIHQEDQIPATNHQSQTEIDQSPEEEDQDPAKIHQKDHKDQSSAETHQELERHQKDQNPETKHQYPVKQDQSPAEEEPKDQSAAEEEPKDQSLAEKEPKDKSLAEKEPKDQSLAEEEPKDHSLVEKEPKDQSLREKEQKDQSVAEEEPKDQCPAEEEPKDQSLAEEEPKDQSLAEEDPKDRSLAEEEPKDQSLEVGEEKDRSPSKKDQSPVETHQSPPDKHQNPVQKSQNPAKKSQKDHKHQTLAEKNQKRHSPAKKHHTDQKVQSPAKTNQSPLESDKSPGERHQKDQSHAKKHKKEQKNQSHTDKPQSSVGKHQNPTKKQQNRAKKQQKDQNPAEDSPKDQSPPEELDKEDLSKPTDHQNLRDCSPRDEPEGPLPADPSPTEPDPQHLEGSTLTEEPPPKKQTCPLQLDQLNPAPLNPESLRPDPIKPGPLSTDENDPGDSPEQIQEPDKEPKQDQEQKPKQGIKQELHQEQEQAENKKSGGVTEGGLDEANQDTKQEPECEPDPSQDHQNQKEPPASDLKEIPPGEQQNPPCPTTEGSTLTLPAPPLAMQPRLVVPSSGEPKLCGFLQKQGGPLRSWKQRWFTYEEKKNQLFYYRTPQDVTPLGRVELSGATFTYPLKAEKGTFHIRTPERTFILKAVNQELMLYWLQQLQVKRWQHSQTCTDLTHNNNTTDDFLPVLQSPVGLVGEEAANVPTQRGPLADVSIKHPLIEIQNSVHCLRKKSIQDGQQSVFHLDAPPWTPPTTAESNTTMPSPSRHPSEPPTPPPLLPLADPAGQVSPVEGCSSPSLFESLRRKSRTLSTSTVPPRRKDSPSSTSRLQQEKQMLMEEVKAQKELVWILHRALEASQLEKRSCAEFLSMENEQERLELLRHRERQAAALRARLQESESEVEAAKRGVAERDARLAELQENIRMLTEKNQAKQEVIIKLSNQVTECLSERRQSASTRTDSPDSLSLKQLQQDVENLKDDIEAYKIQNKFLNSEIFQLTKLWRNSSEQEKNLMVKCAYLEATSCQEESRYLGVLQKLQETKSLDSVHQEAVQRMIKDALKGEFKSVPKLRPDRDYDEYGFKIIPDYEVEDMKLLAKIQALEIRSHNLLHQDAVEHPLLSRWAQYLAGRSDQDLCSSPELKLLVRGGVPLEYRPRVWRWMIWARTRTIKDQNPQHYQELCEKSRTSPHPASRQIQLDLHRTLTTNQNFSSPSSPALQQLCRILLAFSWQNPAIGYCQGLNRLAAVALLVLQNEEDAFWCLVAVVETIMPQDYYTKNLVASQADQRVLKDLLVEKLPRLAAHFEELHIDVSLVTFNWFLVVFVESLPSDILLPLWDAFLYEGTKVIFRYALALFKYKEEDILKFNDSVEVYQYLRFFTKTISDSRRLSSIAFGDMNPFPSRLLRNRRALHLERLQGELCELEEQQRQYLTPRARRKDKEVDTAASEDDDEL